MTVLDQILGAQLPLPVDFLQEAVGRIVRAAGPERIIVFGSAARGELTPDSDVDFLVVKRGDYDSRRAAARIYRALADLERDTDAIVVTPEQLERYKDCLYLALYSATREGKVVYDRSLLQA
jgi:predicted nucleotidyltransferase